MPPPARNLEGGFLGLIQWPETALKEPASSCHSALLSLACGFPSRGLKITVIPNITLCSRW